MKLFSVLCAASILPGVLYAGLAVTPARQEITLSPGSTYQGAYNVRNDYGTAAKINVEYKDWFTLPENQGISVADWLSVSPSEFDLKPGESRDVAYTVQLSTSVRGVSVAMVSFVPGIEDEQGVTMMISASLFVTAAGTERIDWSIENARVEKNSSQLQVVLPVRNNGNIHVRPTGLVEILSRGKKLFDLNVAEGRPVYPGTSRMLYAVADQTVALKKGRYDAVITLTAAGQEKKEKISFKIDKNGVITTR